MKGCHICEVPEPKGLEEYKRRMTFIAELERGTPMWEHVVGHARQRQYGPRDITAFLAVSRGEPCP